MVTTFLHVVISIEAKGPKAAYRKLWDLLCKGAPDVSWETDTYITGDQNWDEGRSTIRLFPKNK